MATAIRRTPNIRNRNAATQQQESTRAKIWILLAIWAMLMFGISFFLIYRLSSYDMAKKQLERPLLIQSAPAVASYRSHRPHQQHSNFAGSQHSAYANEAVNSNVSLAE